MNILRHEDDDDGGRYRRLVDAVTDYAIYMVDPSGIVVSWNTGAERFKGYTAEEVIGQHFSLFYTEEDRARGVPQKALETSVREGKFESEGWRVRKNGTRFWAHVVIDPMRAPDGSLIGFAKVTRDLTERREAEQALRKSEEQFRLLIQGVTDYAIFMLNPDGTVANWNPGAQRIKGYLPEEIVGKHFSEFYTPEDRERGEPRRALNIATKEGRFEREGWRVRKDGTKFWSHVVIDRILDEDGQILGFAKITQDITEKKAAQEDLEQARAALFQSQKMDAIGQLTGGVAHDFNNLLMAVLVSVELLRKRLPDDAQMLRLADNVISAARRGTALTQRMLAFGRRQQLDTKSIDLPNLVRGMTELLQRSLGSMIEIETHFPLALSKVMADENQLELALLNLMVNARDAMADGGRILISAQERLVGPRHETGLPAGGYVCLSVKDEGEGMSEDVLARAAEPFFTTKGVGKGTGLGLSMVHGMSEQMGGRLILKSAQGQGTTAEIWLRASPQELKTEEAPPPVDDAQPQPGIPLRVLAVDDDALVLFNTRAMLEELGHTVWDANSGATALNLLRREEIDVVITDQSMPKMTGVQLIEAIKAEWPKLNVILATGYAEIPGGTAEGIPKLNKPFSERDLARVLATAVR
jgi:PAS domain S-box-containing protein